MRFREAVERLLADDAQRAFVELGPHPALRSCVRHVLQHGGHGGHALGLVPTLSRGCDAAVSLLGAAGALFALGCAVDFAALAPPAAVATALPRYPWDHGADFWRESRVSRAARCPAHAHHELLGSLCADASALEPVWRNVLRLFDVPWLVHHRVAKDTVFPCAAYVAMAGEAILQQTGSRVFTLRDLVMKRALVLRDSDDAVELLTTMRPARLTDTANSSWFDVAVSSYDGHSWTQHFVCQGQAGDHHADAETPRRLAPYPRRISAGFWYERLQRLGLAYEPRFQGLTHITAHTRRRAATATACDDSADHESRYAVHPTTIDLCLQLLVVAGTNGMARRLDALGLAVPSAVGLLCVRSGGPRLALDAVAEARTVRGGLRAALAGRVKVVDAESGLPVVDVEEATCTRIETQPAADDDRDAPHAAHLQWRPDLDFVPPADLIRPSLASRRPRQLLDRLCALCILRTLCALPRPAHVPDGHLSRQAAWLEAEKQRMLRGDWAGMVPEAAQWASLSGEALEPLVSATMGELEDMGGDAASTASLCRHMSSPASVDAIFCRGVQPVLLAEQEGFAGLYNMGRAMFDCHDFFSLCAHSQPTLRVLEVGAGTGGTTVEVVGGLTSRDELRTPMYSRYDFTDISPGFFSAAKQRFGGTPGIHFRTLDVTKDPAEQGFELGSYDLVVASNVRVAWSPIGLASVF